MGVFDNLSQAQVFENSKYFQDGRYIVELLRCKFISGGHKGDSFVIETKVHFALSDHEKAPKKGETAAHVWNASGDKRDIGRSTWLGFLCKVYNVQPTDYDDKQWKKISVKVLDDNKLAGTMLYLEVFTKIIEKTGKPFTQHAWKGVAQPKHYRELGVEPPKKKAG